MSTKSHQRGQNSWNDLTSGGKGPTHNLDLSGCLFPCRNCQRSRCPSSSTSRSAFCSGWPNTWSTLTSSTGPVCCPTQWNVCRSVSRTCPRPFRSPDMGWKLHLRVIMPTCVGCYHHCCCYYYYYWGDGWDVIEVKSFKSRISCDC